MAAFLPGRGTTIWPARGAAAMVCVWGLLPGALATAEPAGAPGLAPAAWRLETVRLHDGRRLEGLVVSPDTGDPTAAVEFVQIIEPRGRPRELITWPPLAAARVAVVERLPAAEHAELAGRVAELRGRASRRHAAETAVALTRADEDAPWRYAGAWCTVESTADPRLTRQAIVHLEQVFAALEALVPPATAPDPTALAVVLCGTAAEYRRLRESLAVRAEHPAFYVPARGLLVAGSDMPAVVEQEQAAGDSLALAERRLLDRDRTFADDLRRLAGDLEGQGMPAAKRAEIVQLARTRWQRERDGWLAEITAARRDNLARVAEAKEQFFARLTHEAWHAYADRRLAPRASRPLPGWLDEGLAQVFETAPLEAGEMRLDTPDPVRLKMLQELLDRSAPPALAGLVRSGPELFLVGHGTGRRESRDRYLLAWGLALDLAILDPVLSREALERLCTAPGSTDTASREAAEDPGADFERLVGMPLERFEEAWRRRLRAARR